LNLGDNSLVLGWVVRDQTSDVPGVTGFQNWGTSIRSNSANDNATVDNAVKEVGVGTNWGPWVDTTELPAGDDVQSSNLQSVGQLTALGGGTEADDVSLTTSRDRSQVAQPGWGNSTVETNWVLELDDGNVVGMTIATAQIVEMSLDISDADSAGTTVRLVDGVQTNDSGQFLRVEFNVVTWVDDAGCTCQNILTVDEDTVGQEAAITEKTDDVLRVGGVLTSNNVFGEIFIEFIIDGKVLSLNIFNFSKANLQEGSNS